MIETTGTAHWWHPARLYASFQHDQFATLLREMMQRERCREFENVGELFQWTEISKRAQAIGSGSWRNFHSINTDALAEIHEMRRSVRATAVRRSKNCIQHRTDGALPISARDVEKA